MSAGISWVNLIPEVCLEIIHVNRNKILRHLEQQYFVVLYLTDRSVYQAEIAR